MQREPRLCSQCRRLFEMIGDDWYQINRMHQDRIGDGPISVCSRECAIQLLSEQVVIDRREPLMLADFRRANVMRCEAEAPRGFAHPINGWSPLEWAGAMCGEAGEAANKAKKLLRTTMYHAGEALRYNRGEKVEAINVGLEYADAVIYGDLMLARIGLDSETMIRAAFNSKSIEIGSDILI
jgi:hypothetical protein